MFRRTDSHKKDASNDAATKRGKRSVERTPRHSSGWGKILARLQTEPGLKILDIGPTSPNNINFLTNLGHSIYMADLVEEAVAPKWLVASKEEDQEHYDTDGFLASHMDFGGRKFDIVLLWDTLDYVPTPLAEGIVERLASVLMEHGQILAFFHSRATGPEAAFCRYHVLDGETIQAEERDPHPVLHTYQNRQIEALMGVLGSCRLLLTKDNTREAIVTR